MRARLAALEAQHVALQEQHARAQADARAGEQKQPKHMQDAEQKQPKRVQDSKSQAQGQVGQRAQKARARNEAVARAKMRGLLAGPAPTTFATPVINGLVQEQLFSERGSTESG